MDRGHWTHKGSLDSWTGLGP